MKNNILFISILLLIATTVTANAEVCGRVTRGSNNAQMIPLKGTTKTQLVADESVSCGSMLITHSDSVWVELSDLTQFKIAPDSFFEFSKKESNLHKLYRGEVMVSAPPSIHEFELTTPNSISVFHGGVILVRYTPKNKETTLASFNRKVEFKNKFHTEAQQVVNVGEMSRLWIGESRIIPSQPETMSPNSVSSAFKGFSLSQDEITELTAISQRTIESRSKSMIADLENWEDIEKESEQAADRSIASTVSKPKKVDLSIDLNEAKIGMELMKKHLYGDEEDQKIFDESRHPASLKSSEKLKDIEYQRKKAKEGVQIKKVLENIRGFDPEKD